MDRFGDVWFNFVLQPTGGTAYIQITDCHRDMRIDKLRCFSVKQAVHPCWQRREAR